MRCKKKERVVGEGLDEPCLICKKRRFTEKAHFPKRKRLGGEGKETIPLCPTHHKLLEHGLLSKSEFEAIWRARFVRQFASIEEFVEWVHDNCYPYSVKDMGKKFWLYEANTTI